MTTIEADRTTTSDAPLTDAELRHHLAEAEQRWQSAEATRSALTVFSIVMAGMALIASIVAWGFATSRGSTPMAMGTGAASPAPSSTATAPFAAATVPVTLAEYSVGLPATTVTAGVKTLSIANNGTMEHELLVFHPAAGIDPKNLPVDSDGNILEDAPGVNKISDGDNIDPGQSQTRSLDLTEPGTYVFVCNLPGHYRLGMRTVVTVVAPNA